MRLSGHQAPLGAPLWPPQCKDAVLKQAALHGKDQSVRLIEPWSAAAGMDMASVKADNGQALL